MGRICISSASHHLLCNFSIGIFPNFSFLGKQYVIPLRTMNPLQVTNHHPNDLRVFLSLCCQEYSVLVSNSLPYMVALSDIFSISIPLRVLQIYLFPYITSCISIRSGSHFLLLPNSLHTIFQFFLVITFALSILSKCSFTASCPQNIAGTRVHLGCALFLIYM